MVSGRFTGIRICLPGQETGRKDTADYRGLYPEREQMTNLFVLIDCRLEPQKIDLEFMEWLGENGVPFSIIFTKADKLTNGKVKDNVNKYLKKLTEQWEELPPHFVSSSEKKTGRQEILDYIDSINRSLKA